MVQQLATALIPFGDLAAHGVTLCAQGLFRAHWGRATRWPGGHLFQAILPVHALPLFELTQQSAIALLQIAGSPGQVSTCRAVTGFAAYTQFGPSTIQGIG